MKNLILLTVDTLRKDVVGCYPKSGRFTPFIDSLQDKCIMFTRAQSTGPYTQASFPGILASSYYLEYGREKKLSSKRALISEVLKNGGVTTAGFHSNPFLSGYFGWDRGWDVFYDSMEAEVTEEVPYIRGAEINKRAIGWLSSYIDGKEYKPFFLWLHYMDVHEPYIPEEKYVNIVDASVDLSKEDMFNLFKRVLLKRDVADERNIELLKKLYCAKVLEVDDHIKEFFAALERLRLLHETTIIITSDHGEEFNEHAGLSHDGKMYRELIDVPLLVYDFGREKKMVSDALVSSVDVAPTIVYMFGLQRPSGFEGHSFLPLGSYSERGCLGEAIDKVGLKEKDTDKPIYFYREGDLKMIFRERDGTAEVYDLKNDPKELNNISSESPMIGYLMEKLKLRIKRWERAL